jgi:serine phosphatase RsbU (regulator of sigma subunit)
MASLVIVKGPHPGRQFFLQPTTSVIGRQAESAICLESQAVSRQHARISCEGANYYLEDLRSSNGTFVNGKRVRERMIITPEDTIQVGPYFLSLRLLAPPARAADDNLVIRDKVNADPSHHSLLGQDSNQKLKAVLEIAQHLARTLELGPLLDKLLDHLLTLFPQADRGLVLLGEGDHLLVRAQRARRQTPLMDAPYSRTVVQRVLQEGVAVLSEDARADLRFQSSTTLTALNLRSLVCVPLICQGGRRLGVLQLDCFQPGRNFGTEDLQLITAVGLQVAVVLENAQLHAELIQEERLRQELALAREIQQGFLPTNYPAPAEAGYELLARLDSAREVSGDLYDFFSLKDGRLAFFVGDVAGKGIPAALLMVAVRTLSRYLASVGRGPAATLTELNSALAAGNNSGVFVTLLHGLYDPPTGTITLTSGGHPFPLLCRADGTIEEVALARGRLLGFGEEGFALSETHLSLAPGETLIAYTDGYIEARAPDGQTLFGLKRLRDCLGGPAAALPLEETARRARAAIEQFAGSADLQDDRTMFLLRRVVPTAVEAGHRTLAEDLDPPTDH